MAFHLWLLTSQLWGGELVDLSLVTRWLIAGGLLLGLRGLRLHGASIFWGRKAIALWVLVALLHGPALVEHFGTKGAPTTSDVVAVLAPVAAAVVGAGLVLLLAIVPGTRRSDLPFRPRRILEPAWAGPRSHDCRLLRAPRPPPILKV